jgi:hypothetical protein
MGAGPQPAKGEKAPPTILKVYPVRHSEPRAVLEACVDLQVSPEWGAQLVVDAKNSSIIVSGPETAHKKFREKLELIDQPRPDNRELKLFALRYANSESAAKLFTTLIGKNAQVATDPRTNTLLMFGQPEDLAVAEALLLRLDRNPAPEKPKPSTAYEVRAVWMGGDVIRELGPALPEDLKDVAAELERSGMKKPQLIGQMRVRTTADGQFEIKASPDFADQAATFTASGKVKEQAGVLEVAVELAGRQEGMKRSGAAGLVPATGGTSRDLFDIRTKITLPPKQIVVLATAPVGAVTSAVAIQVTEAAPIAPAK